MASLLCSRTTPYLYTPLYSSPIPPNTHVHTYLQPLIPSTVLQCVWLARRWPTFATIAEAHRPRNDARIAQLAHAQMQESSRGVPAPASVHSWFGGRSRSMMFFTAAL